MVITRSAWRENEFPSPFVGPDGDGDKDYRALQLIGQANIMLNYLYFNMEIDDKFHISDETEKKAGDLLCKTSILWSEELSKVVLDFDDVRAFFDPGKNFKHLDLSIEVASCKPPFAATDVRVEYCFPDSVVNSLVPLDGDLPERRPESGSGYQAAYDVKYGVQHGGSQQGEVDSKRIVRIHDIGKEQIDWIEKGELVIKVFITPGAYDRILVSEVPVLPPRREK
jgi:hypothetical protein